jgi:hypothetical protein
MVQCNSSQGDVKREAPYYSFVEPVNDEFDLPKLKLTPKADSDLAPRKQQSKGEMEMQ